MLKTRTLLVAAVLAAAGATSVGLGSSPARAASFDWDGGGGDDNLSTAKNWVGNVAPPNDGSASLRFLGGVRTTPVAVVPWDVFGIVYVTGDANPFTLSGAAIDVGLNGINNGSQKGQVILNDLRLVDSPPFTGTHRLRANPSGLDLHGDIDLQSFRLIVHGPDQVRLRGDITGVNGRIEVGSDEIWVEPGTLMLSGNVNADVDTRSGTLIIDTNQPQPPFTTLTFEGGTRFRAVGTHDINNALQLNGVVTYDGSGILRNQQTITGGGQLQVWTGTPTALLALGPVNNISPFNGVVTVRNGQLELNGGGAIAQLAGEVNVGDAAGDPATAVLRTANPGVLAPGVALTVEADGLADLAGPVELASLGLWGGDLTSGGPVSIGMFNAGGAPRTATLDAPWNLPVAGAYQELDVADGAANPDLVLAAGCTGAGWMFVIGGGQVELRGSQAAGPPVIGVEDSELVLNRPAGPSVLAYVSVNGGTLRTQAAAQLGSTVELDVIGGVLDVAGWQQHVGPLSLGGAQVAGAGGALILHDELIVSGNSTVEPLVSFASTVGSIRVAPGATLTTGTLDGVDLRLGDGGTLVSEEINGSFTVDNGTLRFAGFVDGSLQVDDTLEIAGTAGVATVAVNGDLDCSDGSRLVLDLDAPGAVAGDEFALIICESILGDFDVVEFPPAPAGHFWMLVYGPGELRLRLAAGAAGVGDELPQPSRLALVAYPNPFNPATTVALELPAAGHVRLEVFDTHGRRVAELLNEARPAGRFEHRWSGQDRDGGSLGSGVYFLRLSHPAGQMVRRVTLLK